MPGRRGPAAAWTMAPGSVSSLTSSTDTATSSESFESTQPGLTHRVPLGRRNPSMLRMVLEALQAGEQRRGTSVVAIKVYILHKYPTVDATRFKYLLKQALDTGMRRGLLTRPANSKAKGATGSFKLVPKRKKKSRPRKIAAPTAPQKAREPQRGPDNVGRGAKAAEKRGATRTAPLKPGVAKEKAPKKGSEMGVSGAKLGEATKVPPKSDKAVRAPPSANGLGGKMKATGSGRSQGAAKAHRKIKAEGGLVRLPASKVQNGTTSPTKRKMTARAPTGAAAPRAGAGPKRKGAGPPMGSAPKAQSRHRARKTQAPEGPRKLPTKAAASKASSKKVEARN
ncbi:histone H1.8-like [Dipodomys merriami]|uniref:histone H1.8-like n=1 Tax=Dipodomys merriami TaxID=94247 RepID=UPI00384DC009